MYSQLISGPQWDADWWGRAILTWTVDWVSSFLMSGWPCRYSDVMQLLLATGSKALLQDHVHGRTCLHYAAIHGRAASIRLLLSATPLSNTEPNGPLIRDAFMNDGRSSIK